MRGLRHDHRAAVGAHLVDLGAEGALGLVLHAAVDREDEVVAGVGGLDLALALGDRAAVGVPLDDELARASPARSVVVLQLEPGAAGAVDVDAAEDAAGEVAGGLNRAGSSRRLTPGRPRSSTAAATSSVTWRAR